MTISDETDDSVIEAVKRWHIFNREPSDEHWQNIDSLLHKIDTCKDEVDAAVADEKTYWEREVGDLERKLDDMQAERDAEIGRVGRLEAELDDAHNLRFNIEVAANNLDVERVAYALKLEKKLMSMTKFIEAVAYKHGGQVGVESLRRAMEQIEQALDATGGEQSLNA